MLIKKLISFEKTWLPYKSKNDTTLAQSIRVKNQEYLFEGYQEHRESFLMLFVMPYYGFCPHPTPPNFLCKFVKLCGRSSLYRNHLIDL